MPERFIKMNEKDFFQINRDGLEFLKVCWDKCLIPYSTNQKSEDIYKTLCVYYSEKHRAYHNLSHIKSLFVLCEDFKSHIEDFSSVGFAIWFHDVVYNTKRSDNEEKSAELAEITLSDFNLPKEKIEKVCAMILGTKKHDARKLSDDTKLFLDFDLSILGADAATYYAYSQAIRKEYSWVFDFVYKRERKKILESFLERDFIYNTNEMRKRFEAQARANIENEMREL